MRIEDLSLSQLETLSKNASAEIESNRFLSKVSGVGSRFDRELEGKRLAMFATLKMFLKAEIQKRRRDLRRKSVKAKYF